MTATLTLFAPVLSKEEVKARRKAEKKRHNQQLDALNSGMDNLTHAIYGAQDRVAEARKAVQGLEHTAPTQAMSEYLNALYALLAQGAELMKEQVGEQQRATAEHLFPGRAAKWAAEDEDRYQDRRTSQMEQYAGYSGE